MKVVLERRFQSGPVGHPHQSRYQHLRFGGRHPLVRNRPRLSRNRARRFRNSPSPSQVRLCRMLLRCKSQSQGECLPLKSKNCPRRYPHLLLRATRHTSHGIQPFPSSASHHCQQWPWTPRCTNTREMKRRKKMMKRWMNWQIATRMKKWMGMHPTQRFNLSMKRRYESGMKIWKVCRTRR